MTIVSAGKNPKASPSISCPSSAERRRIAAARRGATYLALTACLVLASAMCLGIARADSSDAGQGAVRLPWSRGSDRFQRQWLVLGPFPAREVTADLLKTIVAPPASAGDAPSSARQWNARTSWSDVIDFMDGTPASAANDGERVLFAKFNAERKTGGAALLSFGADADTTVWVNGIAIGDTPATAGFSADQHRIPVDLRPGANDIVLRLSFHGPTCRLALRVLETGAVLPPVVELSPTLGAVTGTELQVQPHPASLEGAPVHLTAIAPGGRIVGEADAPRGQPLRLVTSGWPDGPYDLRCTTTDAWGEIAIAHLSWFKGDTAAATQRLLAPAIHPETNDDASMILPMLADLVRKHLGKDSATTAASPSMTQLWSPLMEFEELALERSGAGSRVHGGGFVRIAYRDAIDGSPQFCRAYLPSDYDPKRRWPVVIFLHGFNPPNPMYPDWWSATERHNEIAERRGVIYLEPHGRGNAQYLAIGERDVLRCLDEARRRFSVDDDRIYLTGESMGGAGTWSIASRHPDLFAAIAPIFGGWDQRVVLPAGSNAIPSGNFFRQEQGSSFQSIEGLLNVPILVQHGDADASVSVENSRHVVRLLQRWGYDVQYHEFPGLGHEDLGVRDATVRWLLTHRRNAAPRHVRIRSTDMSGAAAYWLRVTSFEEPLRVMAVDAEMIAPGVLRLDTDNVARVSLALPASLCARTSPQKLRVVWNGEPREVTLSEGRADIVRNGSLPTSLAKSPGLEGPISDLWRTPFAVVVGTASDDPRMRTLCREKAESFRRAWTVWQHHAPRVIDDRDLSPEEEKTYSLLLIGGADANLVTRRTGGHIPLSATTDGFVVDGRKFAATDAVAQMIYPSPFGPGRYVMVVAATSPQGLYFWSPISWNVPFGFPTVQWDWIIQDGRRVVLSPKNAPEDAWVAAGVFNAAWQRDDRWTVTGDAGLRQTSPLRQAATAPLPPDKLTRLCGRYQIAPGIEISITLQDAGLVASIVGGAPIPLLAEGETDFALASTASPVRFESDGTTITGLQLLDEGRPLPAKKL